MKTTIVRRLEIDAGHRVYGHEGKCANLHGHRYVFEVTAEAPELDSLGRVIDFSVIKGKLGTWLDTFWDHGTVLGPDDVDLAELLQERGHKIYRASFNPTAEEMAAFLLKTVCPELFSSSAITVTRIAVWETPNCRAEVCL